MAFWSFWISHNSLHAHDSHWIYQGVREFISISSAIFALRGIHYKSYDSVTDIGLGPLPLEGAAFNLNLVEILIMTASIRRLAGLPF